nr:MAG TPA: minor capsid protein [Caudoviricetes sp.]
MLGPEYLASLPEPAVKLWRQAEDDILRDIARRFQKAGAITTTAAWQAWRLEQTRAVYTDTEKKLAEYTGQSREVIRRLLIEAGTEALLADNTIHRKAGKEPPPANRSGQLLNLLNAGYRQTLGTWLNLTATTANTVSGEFEHALSRAWLQVSSGAFDYNTAIRRAVDDLADRMAYVTYPSGHKDTLETAVRRAVLTGVNQTAGKLQLARAEEMGCEFVEVTAHEGARPDHALWQGRIYHIGGEIDYEGNHYEDFVKATGYGTGPGLCGWNCRHNFYPFYPGISLRAFTDERLAELNAPSVEYRGKKYTRYEISQMQRAKERTVRKYKRRFLAESEAGLDTGTSAVRLKAARQDLKQFIRETGSKEDSARISVHGFGRSAAGKANWAAKKADTFQQNLYLEPQPVTMEAIQKVKAFSCDTLDSAGQSQLKNAHKRLLMAASGVPSGVEIGKAFDLNMKPLTQNLIGSKSGNSVAIPDQAAPYIAIHTHPDCNIFSQADLQQFARRDNLKLLTAIGHDGHIYAIEKVPDYDQAGCLKMVNGLWSQLKTLQQKPISELSNEQFVEKADILIRKTIKEMENYGTKFYE